MVVINLSKREAQHYIPFVSEARLGKTNFPMAFARQYVTKDPRLALGIPESHGSSGMISWAPFPT